MKIPIGLRDELRDMLWEIADNLGWQGLTGLQKSLYYESWSRDPNFGGRLSLYMDQRQIRVYIKDSIMKKYTFTRLEDSFRPFSALQIDPATPIKAFFEKPHGRCLFDGRIISWGNAVDWKLILMAIHERSFYADNGVPFAAVLFSAVGKYAEPKVREMVQVGADKIGIKRLVWLS